MSYYVDKVKRKNGFRYRIVKDVTRNGKRCRSYQVLPDGTKKSVAEKICCELALNAQFGTFMEKESLPFANYVEEVYFTKYMKYLSVTTKQGYLQMYHAPGGVKATLGNYFLSEITPEILQDMVNDYYTSGKSPKTIRNYISFISAVLIQAMNDNYLRRQDKPPTAYIRLPKPTKTTGHAYTIEQVKLMLRRAQETGNRPVELLLGICCLAGGLRRSELVGLTWADIMLDKNEAYITVERAVVQTQLEGLTEKSTKTQAGTRIIPIAIGGTVYQLLQKARKEHLKLQSSIPDFKGGNQVFILNRKPYTPITPIGLYKTFRRFMQKECPDLPCYRLHDLRHPYVKPTTKKFTTFFEDFRAAA
ncbi:tyrosine-type recombinase/integrase [Schaedlerella arabinosiphila]|uniref:Tyrosine-type recombinase/integrase n=1 Tax=Schaedlerella arabinosiphila TaxID=2044587 RepID=A0A9X5H6R4_9FIRM|nr:tyrosine-type recombinase/integrase [Schaedlerella arabinosiphila]KAI4442338.1 hypothetical protein C824_004849 [Schaedlerella arabinosiphila]NDO71362.1 tyrosine-type recombinase/integrase [Schaedlerella arabinosiphila]